MSSDLFKKWLKSLPADASNVFHLTTFGGVNLNLSDPNFGRVTRVQNPPRFVQVALKVNFQATARS